VLRRAVSGFAGVAGPFFARRFYGRARHGFGKIDGNLDFALGRLFKLGEIPSGSTDPAYARRLRQGGRMARRRAEEPWLRGGGAYPIIVAQAKAVRAHMLFYGHYDVQPPDPLDLWESPRSSRVSSRPQPANGSPDAASPTTRGNS
jgi:hypothetical protein